MSPVLNQPSSVQRSACSGVVVVRGRDPRTAHLELAHRLVVPRDLVALGVARAQLDERQRQPLERDVVVLGLASASARSPGSAASEATGEVSVIPQPWTISRPWRSSNAAIIARGTAEPPTSMPFIRGEIPAARVRVEHGEDPHPDRGHPGRPRHPLLDEVVEQRLRVEVRVPGRRSWRRTSWPGTDSPTRSRGTSARPAGSRLPRRCRCPAGSTTPSPSECRNVERCE